MKNYKIGLLISIILLGAFSLPETKNDPVPLAPEQYRIPDNFIKKNYPYSLTDLKDRYSEKMMEHSAEVYKKVQQINEQGKWKPTPESIDQHKAPEWFLDAKFGMFIDWGPWSIAGWAPAKENGAMYPDWYEFRLDTDSTFMAYHQKNWGSDFKRDDFLPLFKAQEYDPEKLVGIAKQAGMKYIIPFTKHHGGFCLWPSSFTKRDAGDIGPKRDLIKPLIENCKKEGLKFGFYFSIEEWEYPLIGDDKYIKPRFWAYDTWEKRTQPTLEEMDHRASGKIAVKDFARDYLIPQAVEFIDNYDPDILWYDGEWLTEQADLKTYEIASYFYNQAEGRKEVAVNDRYGLENGNRLRFARGDFYTSEYHSLNDEDKKSSHAWEECRGISQSFGFNWQDTEENVISSKAFIDMFVDIVANGGNLLLIVNLDSQGKLPDIQENRLHDIGKWLAVNGEGIYSTRPYNPHSEGPVSYTRSKDNRYIYAILKEWPGGEINLNALSDEEFTEVTLLGYEEHLEWDKTKDHMTVKFPAKWSDNKNNLPCDYAWILRFKKPK
jgi:alpha-L-fucosidase